jgi:hypothetical protein
MQEYTAKAKEISIRQLKENADFTCVICEADEQLNTYTSTERGVKPLLGWLETKEITTGFAAADRVVGKAAAYLYVLLGAAYVYAPVMSAKALDVFKRYDIHAEYDICPDGIINRMGTGPCPMESAVADVDTPEEALVTVRAKLKEMMTHKHTTALQAPVTMPYHLSEDM